jgi:4-hydroxy-tetrahydrodipicolinate reductase
MEKRMTLRIAIAGAAGRMGRTLVNAASADKRFQIVGATVREGSSSRAEGVSAVITPESAAEHAEVWIDFTTPRATLDALNALGSTRVRAAVVGATGFAPEHEQQIAAHATRIAIVRSNNFSLGVTLLAGLVEQAAQRLGLEWDIEISEAHHRRKLDAPSGTALLLGEAAARGRGQTLEEVRLPPHEAVFGPRKPGGIAFSVTRAGGIVGEHDVRFAAEHEIVTLSHEALDRGVFADGALTAALWAANKPPGLYSMRDVVGL